MLVKANLDLQEAPVQKCDRFKFKITTPRRLIGFFFFFYLDGKTKGKNRSDIFFSHFDNLLTWKEKGEVEWKGGKKKQVGDERCQKLSD